MPGTLNFCDDKTHVRLCDIKKLTNTLIMSGFKVMKAGKKKKFNKVLAYTYNCNFSTKKI